MPISNLSANQISLIQIVDTYSHTEWQAVQIQIRWRSQLIYTVKVGYIRVQLDNCLCWGFMAQSTQLGHVEHDQFT